MSKRVLNARGFTLTELMVTVAILGLVMAAIVNLYMTGTTVGLASQNQAGAQQDARAAVLMEDDLRLAGSGCPAAGCPTPPPDGPLLKITAASPTAITFWADRVNASTTLTAAVNVGAATLAVASAAGFTAGDMLILSNGNQWEVLTVAAIAGNNINLNTGVICPGSPPPCTYPAGSQVGRPRLITYFWDGGNTLFKDVGDGQGLQPLATGIQNFQLTYFDASDAATANLADIRRIAVAMTDQSAVALNRGTFTLVSSVRPRNL